MRSNRSKVAGFIAALVGLAVWLVFAPTALGGSATYSITDGISMNPLLYKGDFAVIRSESNYNVGDVVLYQSQVLHKPVLHRIILIQNGNYFFKGDNNGFVDPGYATRSELTGKLWFHIPHAGAVLGWFGAPVHAALLAGIAAMFVVLTGTRTTKVRRRRRVV
jgi:signal peptidase I